LVLKLGVAGGAGRMGREIVGLALSSPKDFRVAAVGVGEGDGARGLEVRRMLMLDPKARVLGEKAFKAALAAGDFDVMVEVTGAASGGGYMSAAVGAGVTFVSGSTAVAQAVLEKVGRDASKAKVAGVWTPNFSVGVNVWWSLLGSVARALPGYDVEIVEAHHNQKKDAPSGTASRAAELVQKATGPAKLVHGRKGTTGPRGREIGIHAVRMGDVVGEHTAYFSGNAERIEVTHRAHSRAAFAAGALVAVRWVAKQRRGGLFSMADVLGLSGK
jgi:4-hydroxy-tetrahydrodipicolinate reductase